jgi:5-methylcytosine-specific restriction enzyme A
VNVGDVYDPREYWPARALPEWVMARRQISAGAKILWTVLTEYYGEALTVKQLAYEIGDRPKATTDYLRELCAAGLVRAQDDSGLLRFEFLWPAPEEAWVPVIPERPEMPPVPPPAPGEDYSKTRRRRMIEAGGAKVPPEVRDAVFARDGTRCRLCGAHGQLGLDHLVPISRGGKHEIENLWVLCIHCNASKGTK